MFWEDGEEGLAGNYQDKFREGFCPGRLPEGFYNLQLPPILGFMSRFMHGVIALVTTEDREPH